MKQRIFRSTAILVALAILVTFATSFLFMYKKLENNMEQRVDNEVNYLATAVEELGDAALETGLADGLTGRITLIDAAGNVLYDSYEDPACMENHAMRPEVAQAIKEGYGSANRYSTTYAKRSYYAAVRLSNDQILRVGDTIDSVYGVLFPGIGMILLPLALLLGLSFVIIDKTTKRMMEPLLHINLDEPRKDVQYDEMVPFLRRIEEQNEALKEQMQERNKQQQEYAAITENMKDGLIVTNRHRVLSINRAAQRIFEIRPEECMGQNIIVVNRNQKLKEVVDGALSGKDMIKHMTIDDVIYELHGNPVMQDGYTSGVVIFIMDVTQKKQLEIMRQEFSANVSHELKTPLMSISGYAELLKDGIVRPEDQKEFAQRIYQEAARLTTLVQDIIRLSKLDDENLELEKEPIDLFDMSKEIIETLQPAAKKRGISLSFTGKRVQIKGMRQIIYEMLYNVCDNAIHYNKDEGSVVISSEETEEGICWRVEDTGIGIPLAEQERIFERFYRVDKSHSRATGGTGLGLSIVKHAAELHGARVRVDSVVDQGTTITIIFPKE